MIPGAHRATKAMLLGLALIWLVAQLTIVPLAPPRKTAIARDWAPRLMVGGLPISRERPVNTSIAAVPIRGAQGPRGGTFVQTDQLVNINRVRINTLVRGARLPTVSGFGSSSTRE